MPGRASSSILSAGTGPNNNNKNEEYRQLCVSLYTRSSMLCSAPDTQDYGHCPHFFFRRTTSEGPPFMAVLCGSMLAFAGIVSDLACVDGSTRRKAACKNRVFQQQGICHYYPSSKLPDSQGHGYSDVLCPSRFCQPIIVTPARQPCDPFFITYVPRKANCRRHALREEVHML